MEVTGGDRAIGYAACILSCVGFGTMFAPLRRANCGDGFFVQWVQCAVIFMVGFVINCIRGFPPFDRVAAIGGLLYATGNVFSVPIVRAIGVGPGMLIWGTVQVLVGWAVARFGFFTFLKPSPTIHDVLNYIGMVFTLICGVLFVFVKYKKEATKKKTTDEIEMKGNEEEGSYEEQHKTIVQKIPYVGMAACLGILHGLMMMPVDIARQNKTAPTDKYYMFDFVFSHFSTVFMFSSLYFFVYCGIFRGRSHVQPSLVLPSVAYGLLWALGMTLWFLSSDKLEQTVAYPITTRLPATIGALTDVFVYKTIEGRRNILYLSFVVLLSLVGVVLIALSNQPF